MSLERDPATGNPALEAMTHHAEAIAALDASMANFARQVGVICGECVLPDGVITRARYIRPGCDGPVDPQQPGHPGSEYTGKRCPVFQHPVTGAIDYCLPPDNRVSGAGGQA